VQNEHDLDELEEKYFASKEDLFKKKKGRPKKASKY
jgi:hypothetical protein